MTLGALLTPSAEPPQIHALYKSIFSYIQCLQNTLTQLSHAYGSYNICLHIGQMRSSLTFSWFSKTSLFIPILLVINKLKKSYIFLEC